MNKSIVSLVVVLSSLLILLVIAVSLNISENNKAAPIPAQLNIRQSFENEGYKNTGKMDDLPCTAQEPTCGYCSGIIIDNYCYIKP